MKKQIILIFVSIFAFNAFADGHDYHKNHKGTSKAELEYKSEQYLKGQSLKSNKNSKHYKDKDSKEHKDFYDKKRKYGP